MKARWATEDWWAVWIGMTIFALSLPVVAGLDVLGWGVTTRVWMNPAEAMAPVSKRYAGLPGLVSVGLTYLFMLACMSLGARALGWNVRRFAAGFTVIFCISQACWVIGNFAYIAATPDKRAGFGIGWSLG